MARGAEAKEAITKKLLEIYGNDAAVFDKVLRIRMMENGEPVEIKITLTAAKDNLMTGGSVKASEPITSNEAIVPETTSNKPTDEEIAQIDSYIKQLSDFNL